MMLDRKTFLGSSFAFGASALSAIEEAPETELAPEPSHHFKIGVCDWNIKAKGLIHSFEVAKELGIDGVQVSYEPRHPQVDLRKTDTQKAFLQASRQNNVEIASMAMGIFNKHPFATHDQAPLWSDECLDIMKGMGQKLVLFAFFGKGDIKNKPDLQLKVIERLKELAPKAEKLGLTIGLETWLNHEEHMYILDAVGSNAIKVYYDTANMLKMGYDIYREIPWLGAKNAICQIHTKEVGNRLGEGKVNFERVKDVLAEINYKDWLVMEAAVKGDWKESYLHNRDYLDRLFNQPEELPEREWKEAIEEESVEIPSSPESEEP